MPKSRRKQVKLGSIRKLCLHNFDLVAQLPFNIDQKLRRVKKLFENFIIYYFILLFIYYVRMHMVWFYHNP